MHPERGTRRGVLAEVIISVDPGKMTGFAVYHLRKGPEFPVGPWPNSVGKEWKFVSWERPTWEAVKAVDLLLQDNKDLLEAVVCESYHITMQTLKKTRTENWSMESIGALRYVSTLAGIPFILQSPADRMFSTDAKLKAMNWWNPSKGGHANDAARHMMLYLARTDRLDETRP